VPLPSRLVTSSNRGRLVATTILGTVALLLLLASPAAAHYSHISGTVTGQRGEKAEPLAEVHVTVSRSSTGEVVGTASTNSEGNYEVPLTQGTYDVRFDPPTEAFQSTTVRNVEVDAPRLLNLVLSPHQTVDLTGTLLDAEGNPVAEADVSLSNQQTGGSSRTDAEGRFDVAVTPGEYVLAIYRGDRADGWSFSGEGDFELGSSREITLRLPARHRLTFEVLGSGGAPIAGARVGIPSFHTGTVQLAEGVGGVVYSESKNAQTGEDGKAEFSIFGGTPQSEPVWVEPPAGSGYGETRVTAPTVEGDTTVVVSLGSEAGEDTTPPSLNELGFEPSKIDVSASAQTVSIGAEISDDLSGLSKATISFRSPSGEVQDTALFERVGGTATAGDYRAKVPFERFSEAGEWRATVTLTDEAGNRRELTPFELQELGFVYAENVINEEPAEESDHEAPKLAELAIEPGTIDVSGSSQTVRVGARITDDFSGLSKATISFRSPSGEVQDTALFERSSGTTDDGQYVATVPFERFSEAGEWRGTVALTDNAGNRRELESGQLEELGFPAGVVVTSGPPVVTEIYPGFGSETGGTDVRISGSGLGAAEAVDFGATAATKFWFESPTSIVAVAPPGTGTVDITVTTPAGTSATTSADRFSYSPPVTLSSSVEPSTHGQKVTLTAKVAPTTTGGPAPQGTMTFEEGSSTLGVANLTSKGTATLNTTTLGAGEHKIVAAYSGDSRYGPGESEPLLQEVEKATTQVTLAATLNPSAYGSSATLKATVKAVAPGAGTPAGTVTFSEGSTVLATVQLAGSAASLPLKSLSPGAHEITATYSGDHDDYASEAPPFTETIASASTQMTIYSTLNPAPFGASGTIKATVSPVAPGGGVPTGTITFSEGESALATVPLSGGSASYSLKTLAPGEHAIHAIYSGAPGYLESEGTIKQEVTRARTELSLTSTLEPAPFGSSGTLKATVGARAPGGGTPAGTVTFREGEVTLATVPLSGSVAKLALKEMAPREHTITAVYSGNVDYEASEDSLAQTITKATTRLTLTSSKNPAPVGSTGTIKATLATVAPGGGQATGTVTFTEGSTTLATVPLSGAAATYPLKSLPAGTHEIVATYNGATGYESSSGSIGQVISP
jgi:Bacterial Ig-like domain (group 3)/Carboxypeptidase regulatory-like domain/IPT/TIG domain/Bacterial Ig-like domain